MARVIFGTKLRERRLFYKTWPCCTIYQTQEDPPWGLGDFGWVFIQDIPPCIAYCRIRAQARSYRGNGRQKSFLIHCTRHFIRNLFIFFSLFSSKTHWMSMLGSCQYHFMAMVFKLLVLHSGLETSENINSVHACRI